MPAIDHHRLHKRIESGSTFAISFGSVAAVIVIACVVFGFIVPEYRIYARRSSRSSWKDASVLTSRSHRTLRKTYPPHPAVRPLLHKPSTARILPTYDPRTESPFPGGSTGSVIESRSEDVRAHSTPIFSTSISSNGLFTPNRRSTVENDESKNKYHTVPRAIEAKHFAAKSSDFGDAKDFILAVPEPLILRPREAGRPPAVTRHLQKYGPSLSASPANSDRLLHPNKLFRAVERSDVRNSVCSSTSMRVDHRQSDATAFSAKDVVGLVDKAIEDRTKAWDFQQDVVREEIDERSKIEVNNSSHARNENPAAIHRLRSYHSLTGGQPTKLARAGTLTRPKTPVDELRKLYNRQERNVIVPMLDLPAAGTTTTLLNSMEETSDQESVSTPATSPTLPPSHLKLLPTPLCPKRSFEPGTVRIGSIVEPYIGGFKTLEDPYPAATLPHQIHDKPERISQSGRGFYHSGRRLTKPAPLELQIGLTASSSNASHPHRSFTEFSHSVFGPLIKSNGLRSRARASSLYSRDTHGFSMVNTPITPDFPTPVSEVSSDRYTTGNPFRSQESVKARIGEWTQRIEENTASYLPRPRQVSPFSPSCPRMTESAAEGTNTTRASMSDMPHRCEADDGNRDQPVGVDTKNAPGGATWI